MQSIAGGVNSQGVEISVYPARNFACVPTKSLVVEFADRDAGPESAAVAARRRIFVAKRLPARMAAASVV
jgi:hypothetical protein